MPDRRSPVRRALIDFAGQCLTNSLRLLARPKAALLDKPASGTLGRVHHLPHDPGDDDFLIRRNHAHSHAALLSRDDSVAAARFPGGGGATAGLPSSAVGNVSLPIELQSKKLESLADLPTNLGGMFTDAGREHQGIEPAHRRRKGPDPFS